MRYSYRLSLLDRIIRIIVAVALTLGSLPLQVAPAAGLSQTATPDGVGPRGVEAAPLAAPAVSATKRDALVGDLDSDGKADLGDTLRYTVVVRNNGTSDATGVTFNDTIDANTTLSGTVQISPLALDDTYNTIGNVHIVIPAPGVLGNDFVSGATLSSDATSANGGSVAMNADGSFTYNPPVGFTGTDTFTYRLTNTLGTDQATVTITVSGKIWFINNNAGSCSSSCDGRLTNPFTTLAAFQAVNNGTGSNPAANDNIFIYESASDYTGPVTLVNGQKLIGQDATASLLTITGLSMPSGTNQLPAMNSGNATKVNITSSANAINLNGVNGSNLIRGLTVGNTTGDKVSGSSFGTLNLGDSVSPDVTLMGSGRALNLSTGALNAFFSAVSSSSGANNFNLSSVSGTASFGTGALSGASSDAFVISGGAATITYNGTINNATARPVNASGKSGGTVTFGGAVSGTSNGILLSSNTGATINFTGGLNLSTGANTAFSATGGGTVNATQNNTSIVNTLATTTGTALNVTNTTIGASGLTFRSITSNGSGAANGIILDTTGSSGGLTVTGNGGSCTSSGTCTGGTISNKAGADLSTTQGSGIFLNSTSNASFTRMQLNDFQNFAIRGTSVMGFTLDNSHISGVNGDNVTAPINEGSISFDGLFGTTSITNSDIRGGRQRNIRIVNSSGTANITISGNTIRDTSTLAGGDDNLFIEANTSATITAHVQNNTFKNSFGDHMQVNTLNSATMTIVFTGNFFSAADVAWSAGVLGGGITISGGNAGSSEHVNFNVSNNGSSGSPLTGDIGGGALNINQGTGGGTWLGQVSGNWIGDPATANSGSTSSAGIRVENHSVSGTLKAIVDGNHVRQTNSGPMINFQVGDTGNVNAALDLTVTNNDVNTPGASSQHGIVGNFGADTAGTNAVCVDIKTNTINLGAVPPNGGANIRLRQRNSSTVKLPGYTGPTDGSGGSGVIAFESGQNTLTPAGNVTFSVSGLGGGFIGGAACAQPTVPTLPSSLLNTSRAVAIQQDDTLDSDDARMMVAQTTTTSAQPVAHIADVTMLRLKFTNDVQPRPSDNTASLIPTATTINQTIGTLPVGKVVTITFEATINNPVPDGTTQVSNQGTVSGSNFSSIVTDDPDTPAPNDPTITPLDIKADLQLSKSDGGVSSVPGGVITYTLNYTNAGPQSASGVTLTETVPANTTFAGTGWTCTPNNNAGSTCTFNVGTLALNASGAAAFVVTVINPVAAGVTQISNMASIGSSIPDPTPGNNTANDTTPVTAAPDLQLGKSDGGASVAPGGTVVYTLTYTNAGNQGATGIVLTETVPANTTFNAGASSAGWTCAPNNNAGSVCTLSVGALNGGGATGSRTFAVTVVNPVAAGVTQISNTASVGDDGANGADTNPSNNTGSDTTPVNAAPDLQITKSDGGLSVVPDGNVTYTLNFTNAGNQGATGVVLTETVPANTTFNASVSTVGWSCANGSPAGTTCTLSIGSVAANGAGLALFAVTVVNPVPAGVNQISNTASIGDDGANGVDPNPSNNSGSDTTPVNAAPDLRLSKSGGGVSVAPGGNIVYTLTYTNAGNQGATGVVLTETIPANTTFTGAGWTCAPNTNAGSVCTFAIGSLAAGSNGSATFVVTVGNPVAVGVNQISNTASIGDDGANGADFNPSDNTASDTTPVNAAPDLVVTKSDGGAIVKIGDPITYTLTYTNAGNQGTTGVVLTETVPANTTFTGAGWSCTPNNNAGSVCTLNVGALNGGVSGAVLFVVTVDNPVPMGVIQISNTVTIGDDGANGADTNPSNNTGSDTTPLDIRADLQMIKTVTPSSALVGQRITYTLSYTNNGPQPASGVIITDLVPSALGNVSYTSSGAAITPTAGITYIWQVADLASGADGIITISGVITPGLAPGIYTNTATITTAVIDPNINNNSSAVGVTFINSAPVANAGSDQSVAVGAAVTLDGSGSFDPDNQLPLSYGWTQTGGPAVILSSNVISRPTFIAPSAPTVLTFTLTVTDPYGLADATPDSVVVTVNEIAISNLIAANSSPTAVGNATAFTATINSGTNVAYTWNFGDGATGSGATTTHTYAAVGNYTARVTASNSLGGVVATTPVTVTVNSYRLYLPLITRDYVVAPDLVVQSVLVTSNNAQVVIKNQGNAPVVDEFWVDLYVAPNPPPTGVNQTWQGRSSQGIAWGVTQSALPALQPGGSLTLTLGDAYYWPTLSNFPGGLPAGTPIYVQVDSVNAATNYGAVRESHEIVGGAYNNILGPVLSVPGVIGEAVPAPVNRPSTDSRLPTRPQ